MSRLNFAANMRKEIVQLLDAWVTENSNALLARYLIERNLAAGANEICTKPASSLGEFRAQQSQEPCAPQNAPKPPAHATPHLGPTTHSASDKIFGESSFAATRIRVAS
jgi:hypothetical protein